jgi:hypothetical protein
MISFKNYFNKVKKINQYNESISHYQKINYDYITNRKLSFFDMIENLHVIKKIIDYVNEEYQELNKEDKMKRRKFYFNAYYYGPKNEMMFNLNDKIKDFFKDKIDFFELKKIIYQGFIDDNKITLKNVQESDFSGAKELFKNISLELYYEGIATSIGSSYVNINIAKGDFPSIVVDLFHDVMHGFYDDKALNSFYDMENMDDEDLDFDSPNKYSPEEILHEFMALRTIPFISTGFFDEFFIKEDDKKIKDFLSKNKKMSGYSDQFIDDFLKKLEMIEKERYKTKNFSFSAEQFKFIKKIFQELNDFERVKRYSIIIKQTEDNFSREFDSLVEGYDFIKNVIGSIKNKIKNKKPTWKDFRVFFKNYPNIIKLFSEKKYPDDLEIKKTPNYKNINRLLNISTEISSQIMIRHDVETKNISNPERRIASLYKKIGEIVKKYANISYDSEIKTVRKLLNDN